MIFSFLTSSGVLHANKYLTIEDFTNGLPPLILCCEMALVAPFFYFAYPVRPYKIGNGQFYEDGMRVRDTRHYQGGPVGVYAVLRALNIFDMVFDLIPLR